LLIGAILEERKLKMQFDQQYSVYQRRVSMLFPFGWVRKRFDRENWW
jgi:protein-S-isoprenylcysteine O-methyltransferase Ste14